MTSKIIPFPLTSFAPSRSLFVGREGDAFTVSGQTRVDMSTKGPLRKIFRAIVRAHRDSPSRGLSVEEVFMVGWGLEIASPDAMAGRVYSAISKLRRLGLGEVLRRTEAGYQLDPRCCVIEERLAS
ncbi:MAG: hypothetical protein JST00_17840 [Deltaproteobacteria bacterium]|nr:hypothetical protein [Deltaproteobacteria bacterium]